MSTAPCNYLLVTHSEGEYTETEADFSLLNLTQEIAQWIMDRHARIATKIANGDFNFYGAEWFVEHITPIEAGKELVEPEDDQAIDIDDLYENGGWFPTRITQEMVENKHLGYPTCGWASQSILIKPRGVLWSFYGKHSGVRHETFEMPIEEIEKVARGEWSAN